MEELKRNKNKRGGYSWPLAHEMAEERKERLPGRRSIPEWIKQKMLGLIWEDWSPKQIGGYLKKQENIAVSHETGYTGYKGHRLKIIRMRISQNPVQTKPKTSREIGF